MTFSYLKNVLPRRHKTENFKNFSSSSSFSSSSLSSFISTLHSFAHFRNLLYSFFLFYRFSPLIHIIFLIFVLLFFFYFILFILVLLLFLLPKPSERKTSTHPILNTIVCHLNLEMRLRISWPTGTKSKKSQVTTLGNFTGLYKKMGFKDKQIQKN